MRLLQIIWLCAGILLVSASHAEAAEPVKPASAVAPAIPAVPAAEAEAPAAEAAAAEAEPAKMKGFDVQEYRIEGNKVLPARAIEVVLNPYLGENKTIADVEAARMALEQAYHDAGYLTVLVDIPEQTITGGIVRLKVAEGTVEKIRVKGSRYYDLGRILAKVPELAQDNVPYFPGMQQQMIDANRLADLRITPVLRPGKTPGKVEVELKVEDKLPLHGSVELSNYGGPNTEPLRLSVMLKYDNLWQKEHSLSLQYQTSPQNRDQVNVVLGTYLMPLRGGEQLAMYAVSSKSNVAAVGDLTFLGQGNIAGVRWVVPLRPRPGLYHGLSLGVDYKDFADDQFLAGSNTGHTPITYTPFSLGYNASLPGDEGAMTTFSAALNFNLRGVGDRMTECYGQVVSEFECKRFNAKPDYFYLRGGMDHTRTVFGDMSLYVKADGQASSGPLIGSEQFVAGGSDSVRGYMESEQAGDDGIHGTIELRGPQWANGKVSDLRMLVFADGAQLRVKEALPSQTANTTLSSAGIGLRMQAWKYWSLRMDAGWPGKSTSFTHAGEVRVGFKASCIF